MKFDIPSVIYELPTKEYWKSVYPDNSFKCFLALKVALNAYWRTILSERQNHRCCYCGIRMNDEQGHKDSATIEHVLPRSQGGANHHENYVIACYRCNNARGVEDVEIFVKRVSLTLQLKKSIKRNKGVPTDTLLPKRHRNRKPGKIVRKLEKIQINNMLNNNEPNNFEPGTRLYNTYNRYYNNRVYQNQRVCC